MAINYSDRPSGTSKREWWAQKTGNDKHDYPGSSGNSGSSYQAPNIDTSQLEALQNQYNTSLVPTQQESDTQTQLDNIITSKELGIQGVEQDPIAQKFVTGQSAGLEKSAALKSLPLQTRLANLQSRRQSAADVLKSQLGFETSNVDRQTGLAESASNRAFQQEQADISQSNLDRSFQEGQRQFNTSESRLGETSSGDTDADDAKTEKALNSDIDAWKSKMRAGTANWADAWSSIKRTYGLSTDVIDGLLGLDFREKYDKDLK